MAWPGMNRCRSCTSPDITGLGEHLAANGSARAPGSIAHHLPECGRSDRRSGLAADPATGPGREALSVHGNRRHAAPVRRDRLGYLFISPWLIGFVLFTAMPFVASIWLSFTHYTVASSPTWVGLANYQTLLFDDPSFWIALCNTLLYAVVAVPLCVAAAFVLALLLNAEIRGIGIYRTIFFLPHIVPVVASSVVFMWVLNPQIGLVNGILRLVGIEGPAWLQDPSWSMTTLILLSLWGIGGSVVIYLAGLKDVPQSLYDAARIDGANVFQRALHITMPMMTPVIFFNLVMGIISAFQYFTKAYILTGGGPQESTMFLALYLFYRAWRYLDMGYASALAWIMFVMVACVTYLLFRTQKKWVHYE
jgi:multiple sugar transport system permease protein